MAYRPLRPVIAALLIGLTPLVAGATSLASTAGAASARPAPSGLTMFTSTIYPYSIGYPTGWKHATTTYSGIKFDAFLRPQRVKGFSDNVNIFSNKAPSGISSDAALLRANENQLRKEAHKVQELGQVVVVGHHLTLIGWPETASTGIKLVVTQAFLYQAHRGWYFTLTTVTGDEKTWRPVFQAMLRSFRLR